MKGPAGTARRGRSHPRPSRVGERLARVVDAARLFVKLPRLNTVSQSCSLRLAWPSNDVSSWSTWAPADLALRRTVDQRSGLLGVKRRSLLRP